MNWGYRIVHRTYQMPKELGGGVEHMYAVHEVYWDDGGAYSITEDPVAALGDTFEEAKDDYRLMAEAFRKPVLEWSDFENRAE